MPLWSRGGKWRSVVVVIVGITVILIVIIRRDTFRISGAIGNSIVAIGEGVEVILVDVIVHGNEIIEFLLVLHVFLVLLLEEFLALGTAQATEVVLGEICHDGSDGPLVVPVVECSWLYLGTRCLSNQLSGIERDSTTQQIKKQEARGNWT